MPLSKKQQIRSIRILLTVFYGFLLSTILFRYIIHGIIETIRQPTNPFSIALLVLGGIILISIALAIYATWFDNTTILLVSSIVLICVFIVTLVFGIVRIINKAPDRLIAATTRASVTLNPDESSLTTQSSLTNMITSKSDVYGIIEDITKLIIELIAILFDILGTFILFRYVKAKYAAVPTSEPKLPS